MAVDTLQHLMGRFAIGNAEKDFTVAATGVVLTTGNYFIRGYAGETQLVEHIQVKIRDVDAAATCALDSDGKVGLTFAGTTAVVWTDTALRDLLGFTANLSGADEYTATNYPKGLWQPSKSAAEYPLDLTNVWQPKSTSRVGISDDGTVYSTEGGLLYEAMMGWPHLTDAEIFTPASGTIYQDLQQFWTDIIHKGSPIRVFPDKTAVTSGDYVTGIATPGSTDAPIGNFRDYANRVFPSYNGLWTALLHFKKFVEAS